MDKLTRTDFALLLLLTLLALGLRLWQLDSVPPGWRDDELINTLVISQKMLDGELAVYYPDASGHEFFYHGLNAIMLALFGPTVPGIRWLSAFLGTLAVPLLYLLGRTWFDRPTALTAALALSLSFWGLMYARIGLRHVTMPLLVLAAFYFFWQGLKHGGWAAIGPGLPHPAKAWRSYGLTAVFLALGFYTYFAGRGVPLILVAFMGYIWLVERPLFRQQWRYWAAMLGLTLLLAVPLALNLSQQPESDARVAELAVPLVEARQGNFQPLIDYTVETLSMFHSTGDNEWLYNIPGRPLFGPIGAILFWSGVALALWHALRPLWRRSETVSPVSLACALLLGWWLAGIIPGFISVPPASLGHTILAQPATYLLAALPVFGIRYSVFGDRYADGLRTTQYALRNTLPLLPGLLLVISVATRDLPDYFREWPQQPMVRFLYHADVRELAQLVREEPAVYQDMGVASLLAGPWERLAFELEAGASGEELRLRWYDLERVVLLQPARTFAYDGFFGPLFHEAAYERDPAVTAGRYWLAEVQIAPTIDQSVCFTNGLCWETAVFHPDTQTLELEWRLVRPLDLSPIPLISNPPPPGVYAGPRLAVFAQLLDQNGQFLTGDDGLWLDPETLYPGDQFRQLHRLDGVALDDAAVINFGLYDPKTGQRILTENGRDSIQLPLENNE
jgi:4-amino-4-deoxy-L-arabinose transferase-like glycosyltransferase